MIRSIYWGQIFNNTVADSDWYIAKSISPGRWAVGYEFLYVLYRCLNDVKPQNILELGLGQSTKLITQFVHSKGLYHTIIEHDDEWINFFVNGWPHLSDKSRIKLLPIVLYQKNNEQYYAYQGFTDAVKNEKYELICVDGPFGYMSRQYSRKDIIECLPDILAEKFIILFDDCDRLGERNTVAEVEQVLLKNNIEYSKGLYHGEKVVVIIVSKEWGFLCSV